MIATLTITLDADGRINIQGTAPHDGVFMAMIEAARQQFCQKSIKDALGAGGVQAAPAQLLKQFEAMNPRKPA